MSLSLSKLALPSPATTNAIVQPGSKETRARLLSRQITLIAAAGLAVILAAEAATFIIGVETLNPFGTMIGSVLIAIATLVAIDGSRRRAVEAQARLSALFAETDSGHLIFDPSGQLLLANDAAWTLLGIPPAASEAAVVAAFGPKAVKSLQALAVVARGGEANSVQLPLPGDPSQWRRLDAHPLEGQSEHVHWRVEDVTEYHRAIAANEAQTANQAKLVEFLNEAPEGFFSVDQTGRFLFINATLAGWLQGKPEDFIETRLLHSVIEKPLQGHAPYDIVATDGDEQRGEIMLRGLQGDTMQVQITQTIVRDPGGPGLHTRSVVHDLTHSRENTEAMRLSEQRFKRFFEDAPIGIAQADAEGKLAACNHAFLSMIGRPGITEVLEHPFADLLEPEGRDAAVAHLRAVLEGEARTTPLEVKLRGPKPLVAQLFAKRLNDQEGKTSGLILHFIDLTEQKNLEVQFAQSQKMQAIGQLAGGVAHDFNNLLTAMIGFCDLLLLRHKPGDQSFSDIMQIKQNANRAANLVRQLLAFSRQQTLQPRVLNITDVLAELSNLLRRLIGENIELKMVHGRDLGLVKVDQGQLEQVIINLAVNARDAMAGGGRLTILTSNLSSTTPIRREMEVMPPGEYVAVEVLDTGTGIPKEIMQRIFEPFFSTKEIGSGTGLGLSTVYGIVRQTGGFIFVDSVLGDGAKFTIYLPRHYEKEQPAASGTVVDNAEKHAGDLTGAGTILLVEDEDAVRVFSARALRNKGYQVLEARSGEAALALLASETNRIDLLVSDVVMPQMDGPTLIRQVRLTRPDLKVIFISGYTEDRLRQQLDDGEEIYFLPKPFSLKQLAGKVKEVMREGS